MTTSDTCPVCNMPIDPLTATTTVYNGKTFTFCCESCRLQFEADPEKYIPTANA